MELTDEMLGAYLDDELDRAQRTAFEAALAKNAEARLQLDRLRAADARIKAAYPLDGWLQAGLQGGLDGDPLAARILASEPAASMTNIINPRMPQRQPARRRSWARRMTTLTALAAGIGGIGIGYLLVVQGGGGASGQRGNGATPALTAALDSVPSGGQSRDGATRLVLSFKAADGRFCRVFESGKSDGLACREGNGWQVLALEAGAASPDRLRPAGGNGKVDALMDHLGGEPALDPVQEKTLIDRHWNVSRP